MTTEQLCTEINDVSHTPEKPWKYADLVLDNPDVIPKLLEMLWQPNVTIF